MHHVRRAVVLVVPLDAAGGSARTRPWRSRSRRRSCPWGWLSPTKRRIAAIATTTAVASHEYGSSRASTWPAGGGRPPGTRRRRVRARLGLAGAGSPVTSRSAGRRSGSALSTHSSPGDRRLPEVPGGARRPRDRYSLSMKEHDVVGEMSEAGRLVLLGAPLGNPGDASTRLREVLATADVVAAEDTRRLTRLARDLDITVGGRIVSYFEGNEERRTPELVEVAPRRLRGGAGHRRRHAERLRPRLPAGPGRAGRRRRRSPPRPGPSAVTTALALSGLPCDRFCFEGFLPRSPGARRSRLRDARRRAAHPGLLRGAAPDRRGAGRPGRRVRRRPAGRGLPGADQDVRGGPSAGPLGELAGWAAEGEPRGEITLVVAGAPATAPERPDDDTLRAAVAEREAAGGVPPGRDHRRRHRVRPAPPRRLHPRAHLPFLRAVPAAQ